MAGSVHGSDVGQQAGYPEAALACVHALTVGTGEEEWALGSSARTPWVQGGFCRTARAWGRGCCLAHLQGDTVYLTLLCKVMGLAHWET